MFGVKKKKNASGSISSISFTSQNCESDDVAEVKCYSLRMSPSSHVSAVGVLFHLTPSKVSMAHSLPGVTVVPACQST